MTKESEDSLAIISSFLRKFEDEQYTLLFHGTVLESANGNLDSRGSHLSSDDKIVTINWFEMYLGHLKSVRHSGATY